MTAPRALAFVVGALFACADPVPKTGAMQVRRLPPLTVEGVLAYCAPYAETPDAYGYCISERVPSLASPAAMEALCPKVPTWENHCREGWVSVQDRSPVPVDPAVLLAACGPSQDCAFRVIDTKFPVGDVVADMQRCEQYAPKYLYHCVGHAVTRWITDQRPDAAEVERVRRASPRFEALMTTPLGMLEACYGTPACRPEASAVEDACRSAVERYRSGKLICPRG